MLEGIQTPSRGAVLFQGRPLGAAYREAIGIQFQATALQDFQTVAESLTMFATLYQKTADRAELIDLCNLGEILDRDTRHLSGGQRQRLLLALALVNRPKLLFLDEPSTGLDPQARRNLWEIIENVKGQGKTVVLTTHYMEEAQHLCDEIAIMDHGRIIDQGSPDDLIRRHCKGMTIHIPVDHGSVDWFDPALDMIRKEDRIEIRSDNLNGSIQYLLARNVDLSRMTVRLPNLEDVFLTLTGRRLRD
jgi:ABC-2 type transport system ATP-binding protein